MTDPELTAPDSSTYDGCPCLAYLPWWRAGMVYAEKSGTGWSRSLMVLGVGGYEYVEADADAWSLYHFMLFWGFVDGRL